MPGGHPGSTCEENTSIGTALQSLGPLSTLMIVCTILAYYFDSLRYYYIIVKLVFKEIIAHFNENSVHVVKLIVGLQSIYIKLLCHTMRGFQPVFGLIPKPIFYLQAFK